MAKKLILIDTNFLILAMANINDCGDILKKLIKDQRLVLSTIVIAEFLSKANKEDEKNLMSLVSNFKVIDIDLGVAIMASIYRKRFLKLQRKVYLSDCLIAASCKVNGIALLTLNKKDYPMKDIDFVKLDDIRN